MSWREVNGFELRKRAQAVADDYTDVVIRIGEDTATSADQRSAAELAGQLADVYTELAEYYRHMSGLYSDLVRYTGR